MFNFDTEIINAYIATRDPKTEPWKTSDRAMKCDRWTPEKSTCCEAPHYAAFSNA
jgi:hypothetical protein